MNFSSSFNPDTMAQAFVTVKLPANATDTYVVVLNTSAIKKINK